MSKHTRAMLLVVAVIALGGAACASPQDDSPATPPSQDASMPPAQTPGPDALAPPQFEPPTSADDAVGQATETFVAYLVAIDALALNPGPTSALDDFATEDAAQDAVEFVAAVREDGLVVSGTAALTAVADAEVLETDADGQHDEYGQVRLRACVDATERLVLDGEQPVETWSTSAWHVVVLDWHADGSWIITEDTETPSHCP